MFIVLRIKIRISLKRKSQKSISNPFIEFFRCIFHLFTRTKSLFFCFIDCFCQALNIRSVETCLDAFHNLIFLLIIIRICKERCISTGLHRFFWSIYFRTLNIMGLRGFHIISQVSARSNRRCLEITVISQIALTGIFICRVSHVRTSFLIAEIILIFKDIFSQVDPYRRTLNKVKSLLGAD